MGKPSLTRPMTCVTGLPLLACKALPRRLEGRDFTSLCPSSRGRSWDQVKMFTKKMAETLAKERPGHYVATMAKRARSARIFIDYLRNDRGATAVAAYSPRALPRARFRPPSSGTNFHPDSVQTISRSRTCCIGFPLSNTILGRVFSKFVSGCRIPAKHTAVASLLRGIACVIKPGPGQSYTPPGARIC